MERPAAHLLLRSSAGRAGPPAGEARRLRARRQRCPLAEGGCGRRGV